MNYVLPGESGSSSTNEETSVNRNPVNVDSSNIEDQKSETQATSEPETRAKSPENPALDQANTGGGDDSIEPTIIATPPDETPVTIPAPAPSHTSQLAGLMQNDCSQDSLPGTDSASSSEQVSSSVSLPAATVVPASAMPATMMGQQGSTTLTNHAGYQRPFSQMMQNNVGGTGGLAPPIGDTAESASRLRHGTHSGGELLLNSAADPLGPPQNPLTSQNPNGSTSQEHLVNGEDSQTSIISNTSLEKVCHFTFRIIDLKLY